LLLSLDGGERWTDTKATLLAADLVVVDQQDGPVLLGRRDDGHIVRSTDNGATWVASALPPGPEILPVKLGNLLVSREASPVVYASAFTSRLEPVVLVSTDAGATFVARSTPSTLSIDAVPLSADCRGRLYVLSGTTVYRSTNAGSSWASLAELEAEASSFEVMQGGPAACGDSAYASGQSRDGTARLWQLTANAATSRELPGFGEVMDLGDDRLLLVSAFGLRQRSDDGGRTWWTAGVNLGIGDLVVSPAGAGSMLVSTGGGVYRSDDGGTRWQGAPSAGPTPQDIYPDPRDVNVVYARSVHSDHSPWSFFSTDRGASFQNWPVPTSADPEVPQVIVSTAPGVLTVVTRGGVYVTNDAGRHFARLLSVPAPRQIMSAAVGSSDPPAIYAYVGGDDLLPGEIVASLDGGATWASRDPGTYITNLVVDPADAEVVFARPGLSGDEQGLLRTLDGGLTWTRVAVKGERDVSVQFDLRPPHALYAAGQRLQRSEDHGSTWHVVTELPTGTRDLVLDPNTGNARYVLSERGLVYQMTE
jgi:photosystem II stability/assembly factor-like uncharacterized protein